MTYELSLDKRRNVIDNRLETALKSARVDYLTPAKTVIEEWDDRWYGQLIALVYNSVAEKPDTPSILRAATAMELFRGYYRLREQLLTQLSSSKSDSTMRDTNAELLAANYLYTSAYSTFGCIDDTAIRSCLEILTSISELIIETIADADLESTLSPSAYRSFVNGTVGMLGYGAACIGATLAGADDRQRQRFTTVGH
jgi:geranylgeranyl pyrophosphate synthase